MHLLPASCVPQSLDYKLGHSPCYCLSNTSLSCSLMIGMLKLISALGTSKCQTKIKDFYKTVNCFVRPVCVCAMQVAEAAKLWDGTGALVFSSSAGLYEVDDGSHCNEDCKIADRGSSDRTDR